MKFETKYKIGQEVYYIKKCMYYDTNPYDIRKDVITNIKITQSSVQVIIYYSFNYYSYIQEQMVFATKEEAEQKLREIGE